MDTKQTDKPNIPTIPVVSRFDKRGQNQILKDNRFKNSGVKSTAPQFRIHQHKGA